VLYATITGDDPVGLSHSTGLSNALVLELQQAASATVFNETSHIDYPWQTNSGGGNQTPPMTIPANQTLAWDSVITIGAANYDGLSDIISHNGNTYALGYYSNNISLNGNCFAESNHFSQLSEDETLPFVAKFDSNGTCIWMNAVNVTNHQHDVQTNYIAHSKIAVDSNGDVYFSHSLYSIGTAQINFGNITININGDYTFLAKIDSNGIWQWVKQTSGSYSTYSITVDNGDDVWVNSLYYAGINNNRQFLQKYDSDGNLLITKEFGVNGRVQI
jgi:uncharacterized protein (UPF0333 family)